MKLLNRRFIGQYVDPSGHVRNVRTGEQANGYKLHYYTIRNEFIEITDIEKWNPVPGLPHAFTRFKLNASKKTQRN